MATRPNDSTPATEHRSRLDPNTVNDHCCLHSFILGLKSLRGKRQEADATNADTNADRDGDRESERETPLVLSCLKLIKDSSTYFISTPTGCRATRTGKCGKPKVVVDRNVDNDAEETRMSRGRCRCRCKRGEGQGRGRARGQARE